MGTEKNVSTKNGCRDAGSLNGPSSRSRQERRFSTVGQGYRKGEDLGCWCLVERSKGKTWKGGGESKEVKEEKRRNEYRSFAFR